MPATPCCARWRRACAPTCAPATSSPASAATSSAILIDRLADEEEAIAIADRVAAAFAQPFAIDGVEHFVTASIGIAVARPSGQRSASAELLIRDADAAMYRAKEGGRARCVLFDAEMRASAMRRLEVERELRHALDRDELALHYQPVISLQNRRDLRPRGAGALAASRPRPARPGRVRLDRRGQRPDRADRALGPGARLPADPRVARAAPGRPPLRRRRQPLRPPGRPPRPARDASPRSSPAPASTRSTCAWRSPRASWSRSRRRRSPRWRR